MPSSDIISFRFDSDMIAFLKKSAKQAGLSMNAYAKRVFAREREMISEEELDKRIREAREDYKNGDYIVLKNSKDIAKFFKSIT